MQIIFNKFTTGLLTRKSFIQNYSHNNCYDYDSKHSWNEIVFWSCNFNLRDGPLSYVGKNIRLNRLTGFQKVDSPATICATNCCQDRLAFCTWQRFIKYKNVVMPVSVGRCRRLWLAVDRYSQGTPLGYLSLYLQTVTFHDKGNVLICGGRVGVSILKKKLSYLNRIFWA